ncbi:MAG: Fic family protein [Candidatus Sedimenticola sp. (ex Thyasira tokunagai)]
METDRKVAIDRGEHTTQMEPLLLPTTSRYRSDLTELSFELAARSAGFKRSLPAGILAALSDLVRSMNCYYSNLIEGHDTHPVDIERALKGDYSSNREQRNLQLEAQAHIVVQKWIDQGVLIGCATKMESIKEIHKRFCDHLPPELLVVEDPETKGQFEVVPGELRTRDVKVGRHIPISPGAVERFMFRFEDAYVTLNRSEMILAAAAAHHRLAWIHPFIDGNGRVARLMSHAMLLDALDTGGLWSVARGLARNVEDYRRHLAACDQPRHGDLDGRGNLSEQSLAEFTRFFLEICLDQVAFMEALVRPDALRRRIFAWTNNLIQEGSLPKNSGRILESILFRGELPRSEVQELIGASTRTASRAVSALTGHGAVTTASSRAPLKIGFTVELASHWMPGLFPPN